jgi:hypothetical protein
MSMCAHEHIHVRTTLFFLLQWYLNLQLSDLTKVLIKLTAFRLMFRISGFMAQNLNFGDPQEEWKRSSLHTRALWSDFDGMLQILDLYIKLILVNVLGSSYFN